MDLVSEYEKLVKTATRAVNLKSEKRRYTAIKKIKSQWVDLSRRFLLGHVSGYEILEPFTLLDNIAEDKTMLGYLKEFTNTLEAHTDRMFFNPWIRCTLCLENAVQKGYNEFELEKE